jgi:hypothetical protein
MKVLKLNLFFIFIAIFTLFISLNFVSAVLDCTTLSTPDQVVTLTGNLNSTGTCFIVTASNVTIDCNGYIINYSSTTLGYAVNSSDVNYTQVKNCNIQKTNSSISATPAIYLLNSNYGIIQNNTMLISGTTSYNVKLQNSHYNLITQNHLYHNVSGTSGDNVYISGSDYNNITSNYLLITGSSNDNIAMMSYSNNTIIFNNTISCQSDSMGVFIAVGLNTNVSNNNITAGSSATFGIYASGTNSNNSYIANNFLTTSGTVNSIAITSHNNTIYNNTVRSQNYGISLTSSSTLNNITGNIINVTTTSDRGISLNPGNSNTINNNIITHTGSTGYGIYLQASSNNNLTNNNIQATGGANGSFFNASTGNIIKDGIINASSAGIADIGIGNTGINNFTNVTFNKSDTIFYSGATGSINIFWYMDVYVNDTNGAGISNANVTAWDINNIQSFTELTNSSGYIIRKTLREYWQNATSSYYDTNYNVNASRNGYNTNTTQVNLTGNRLINSNIVFLTLGLSDTPPNWSNNASSIVVSYSPTTQSYFNITWQDDNSINSTWLESNFSGTATNYSMNSLGSNVYNYSAILPAGTFYWKSYANDTLNQWNVSDIWRFTIGQNTGVCDVLFNETSPKTYLYTFKVYTNCDSDYILKRNGTTITNNSDQSLTAGIWNFSVSRTDTSNYSNIYDENNFIIQQATSTCSLTFNPSSPITYGNQVNASCSCTNQEASAKLYRNSTDVTSENNQLVTLGAGNYDYVCNVTSSQNYTSASNNSNYIINPDSGNCDVLFNETYPLYYPNGFLVYSDCTSDFTLYRNGSSISNNSLQTLGAGTWNFSVFRTDMSNYSNTYDDENFIIAPITSTCSLTFNPESPQDLGTQVNASCSCTNQEASAKLYRNSTDVTSENNQLVTLSASTYSYICNVTSSQNYTSASNSNNYIINQNIGLCDVLFNTTSPQTYPISFLVNSNCNSAFILYRNGTEIDNNSVQELAVGTWNFSVFRTDDENYTNIYDEEFFTIEQASSEIALYFDDTRNNRNYQQNQTAELKCELLIPEEGHVYLWTNYSDGNMKLWQEEDDILINETNLTELGYFEWLCNWTGNENYTEDSESRFMLVSETPPDNPPEVTLNLPEENYPSTSQEINFNCTASDDVNLVSVSLWGNWTGWHENETENSPVNDTPIIFTKTIQDGSYIWNCEACDNSSQCTFGLYNRTFTINTPSSTAPEYSNDDDDSDDSVKEGTDVHVWVYWQGTGLDTAIFRTNESGSWRNVSKCSLESSGWCNKTISTDGDAKKTICWNQYANDTLGNLNDSMPETLHCFSVTSRGGGGGGGTTTPPENQTNVTQPSANITNQTNLTTYDIGSVESYASGIEKQANELDKIKFEFKSIEHIITIKEILIDRVKIEISSEIIKDVLLLNQPKEFDLDDDGRNDIRLELKTIADSKVDILLTYMPQGTEINNEQGNVAKKGYLWIFIVILFIVIVIFILLMRARNKRIRGKRRK